MDTRSSSLSKWSLDYGNQTSKSHILHLNLTSQVLRISIVNFYNLDVNHNSYCPKNYINVDIDSFFSNTLPTIKNYTTLYECDPLPNRLIVKVFDIFVFLI